MDPDYIACPSFLLGSVWVFLYGVGYRKAILLIFRSFSVRVAIHVAVALMCLGEVSLESSDSAILILLLVPIWNFHGHHPTTALSFEVLFYFQLTIQTALSLFHTQQFLIQCLCCPGNVPGDNRNRQCPTQILREAYSSLDLISFYECLKNYKMQYIDILIKNWVDIESKEWQGKAQLCGASGLVKMWRWWERGIWREQGSSTLLPAYLVLCISFIWLFLNCILLYWTGKMTWLFM